mmetsp:Transcript_33743/g.82808  ORF Transcript_33743/g.82808 Transcript_33743/m.82808 type:complete len:324 (+) Transcript_33743:188-1159(+)
MLSRYSSPMSSCCWYSPLVSSSWMCALKNCVRKMARFWMNACSSSDPLAYASAILMLRGRICCSCVTTVTYSLTKWLSYLLSTASPPTSARHWNATLRNCGLGLNFSSVSSSVLSKMYPSGIQLRNACSVCSVCWISSGRWLCCSTNSHSSWIMGKSVLSEFLSSMILACVSSPRLKSNTSSDSSLRMFMQFSHRLSLCFAAPTRSGMKLAHRTGQSCFRICTSTLFTLLMYARSRRNDTSSVDSLITRLLMKFLIPSRCSLGSEFQRYLMVASSSCRAKNLVLGLRLCSRMASARVHICSFSFSPVMIFSASDRICGLPPLW